MPRKRDDTRRREAPRTDLPPTREPYDEGYFGTGEEEGVEREREAGGREASEEERRPDREAAEESAGGDRDII